MRLIRVRVGVKQEFDIMLWSFGSYDVFIDLCLWEFSPDVMFTV